MKVTTRFLVLTTVAMTSAIAGADQLPQRKPGLWEVSIASDGKGPQSSMKQCVDATTDAQMMEIMSDPEMKKHCTKNETKLTGGGFESLAECAMGNSKMLSKGVFTGDFSSAYSGEVVTTFDPPFFGNSSSKIRIAAKWAGECPPDMKPGDMATDDGFVMNAQEASNRAKQAAEMLNNPQVKKALQGGISDPAKLQEALKGIQAAH